ncbi:MAG: hypothetical protein E5X23_26765 [Mesorhizobium sp.]|uniref:hypothetical protein n=1 Tax=Mesorhizobium sp. TaxID=1871066 RepID=UPI001217FDA1|nr:hypothetical protein [Mesorhizobium sp.]TJV75836.1 MAG: hypothetical protein E5X23_26765 [Mesorhizobium sp.]
MNDDDQRGGYSGNRTQRTGKGAGQAEPLDRQLQASFGQINGNLARLEQRQPVAADAETPRAPEPSFANTTVAEASAGENPSVGAPAFKGKAAPPGPNPSYQRIQQADGKVYYKKIN